MRTIIISVLLSFVAVGLFFLYCFSPSLYFLVVSVPVLYGTVHVMRILYRQEIAMIGSYIHSKFENMKFASRILNLDIV